MDELRIYIEKGIPDGHLLTFEEAADELLEARSGSVKF